MDAATWNKLLNPHRLGQDKCPSYSPARSPYQTDYDRIVFSSAFRRLQDKTQVVPLAQSDYVRTRLTHSLEVSCVGRSLGTIVGHHICEKYRPAELQAADFGSVVAAASLAHDLGNPPFGHSGEESIRHWFKTSPMAAPYREQLTPAQIRDFELFEGNAQGFRIITRLQMPDNEGGLQLTGATLATFTKYPRLSLLPHQMEDRTGASLKKFGCYQSESRWLAEVAALTGMRERVAGEPVWHRHPLSFLMEAADDISYGIIDLEDGYRMGLISYEEIRMLLLRLLRDPDMPSKLDTRIKGEREQISYLRARAINLLVEEVSRLFIEREEDLILGRLDTPLVDLVPAADIMKLIKRKSQLQVYSRRENVEIENAGYQVLGFLLDLFTGAVNDVAVSGRNKASSRHLKLLKLMPEQFLGPEGIPDPDPYGRLLRITDFVSGMTDSYAVTLYKRLLGVNLPDR